MLSTFKIILRHYLIGLIILVIIFWLINEFPNRLYFQLHMIEWLVTFFSIPIIGLVLAIFLNKKIRKTQRTLYIHSWMVILITWLLIFYIKAITVGVLGSALDGFSAIPDSLVGFTIYQLWVYLGIGIIHATVGGVFLNIDLKKNKKNYTQQ